MKSIYLLFVVMLLTACAEYTDDGTTEPVDAEPLSTLNSPILPNSPYAKISNYSGNYSVALLESVEDSIFEYSGNYMFNQVYTDPKKSTTNLQLSVIKDQVNQTLNIFEVDSYLLGNVQHHVEYSASGSIIDNTIQDALDYDYLFRKRLFRSIDFNQENYKSAVWYGEFSMEIENRLIQSNEFVGNDILINYDVFGMPLSGSIKSKQSEAKIEFTLLKDSKEIHGIYLTYNNEPLGLLSIAYDDKNNPFSFAHVDTKNSNQAIHSMLSSLFTLNPNLTPSQNGLYFASQLLKFTNAGKHNIVSATWKGIVVLNKEYVYNDQGYPIQINIQNNIPSELNSMINKYSNAMANLTGSETITYF